VAGLHNKIRTDGLTTPFPKAMPVILATASTRYGFTELASDLDAALRSTVIACG
jgi:hypothetical protein